MLLLAGAACGNISLSANSALGDDMPGSPGNGLGPPEAGFDAGGASEADGGAAPAADSGGVAVAARGSPSATSTSKLTITTAGRTTRRSAIPPTRAQPTPRRQPTPGPCPTPREGPRARRSPSACHVVAPTETQTCTARRAPAKTATSARPAPTAPHRSSASARRGAAGTIAARGTPRATWGGPTLRSRPRCFATFSPSRSGLGVPLRRTFRSLHAGEWRCTLLLQRDRPRDVRDGPGRAPS